MCLSQLEIIAEERGRVNAPRMREVRDTLSSVDALARYLKKAPVSVTQVRGDCSKRDCMDQDHCEALLVDAGLQNGGDCLHGR